MVDPAFDSGVDEFIQNAARTGRVTVEDLDPFSHPFIPHLTVMAHERKPYTSMRQQLKKTGAIFLDHPPHLPPETPDWDQLGMTWREWFYGP